MQRPNYPWAEMLAIMQDMPGRWISFPRMTNVPVSVIFRIRRDKIRAFRNSGGKVYVRHSLVAQGPHGPVCDIWLRWLPKENKASERTTVVSG